MVKDNVTGLIWEVKTNDDSIHDMDNAYDFYDAKTDLVNQLNNENFGGFSNWRLPTVKELYSLIYDMGKMQFRYISYTYFPYVNVHGKYISSTSNLYVTYDNAHFWFGGYEDTFYVRAVRGQTSGNSFIDNGDGTISDLATGLMWQKGESGTMTWEEALAYCENLSLANHDDWRLPNIKELVSILDHGVVSGSPTINSTFFPGVITGFYSGSYWSSTTDSDFNNTHTSDPDQYGFYWKYYVDFTTGYTSGNSKTITYSVRAVRNIY